MDITYNYLVIILFALIIFIVNVYYIISQKTLQITHEGYTNYREDIEVSENVCKTNEETINKLITEIDREYTNIQNNLSGNPSNTTTINNSLLTIKTKLDEVVESVISVMNAGQGAIQTLEILRSDNPNDPNITYLTGKVSQITEMVNRIISKYNEKKTIYSTAVSNVYNYSANSLRNLNADIVKTIQEASSNNGNFNNTREVLLRQREETLRNAENKYNDTIDRYSAKLKKASSIRPEVTVVYKGTYRDSSKRAMPQLPGGGRYSYDSCLRAALDKGSKYFALQYGFNVAGGECALSNDWKASSKYGKINDPRPLSNGKYYGTGWGNSIYEII